MRKTVGPQPPHGVRTSANPAPAAIQTCFDAALVRAFAAGELDSQELERIDAHLDECPTCQALVVAALASPGTSSSRGELAPDTRLADRYRIVRFIGRGGMGEIYEAHDEVLHERVALKCLAPALADNPKGVDYLKSEAQLARKVSHPNVCRVYDVGVDTSSGSTRFFLSMELLSGRPLSRAIARGALPLSLVADIAKQLLLGLREAHRAGVLHRDFKSDNVLFRSDDESSAACQVAITDFGLSRLVSGGRSHVTISTMCVGSAAYMAPEQVEGGRLTQTTDIYSFGVVVFEMLTGTLPFLSETALATAVLRLRSPAPRVRARSPQLPSAWDEFVARCLERDAARRFQSADAALDALARLEPVARPRHGARGWALALAASALSAATYWAFQRDEPASEAGPQRVAPPARTAAPAGASARGAERSAVAIGDDTCSAPDGAISGVCLPAGADPLTPALAPAAVDARGSARAQDRTTLAPNPDPRTGPRLERGASPRADTRGAAEPGTIPSTASGPARDAESTGANESRHPRFDRLVDPFR